MAQIRPFRAIRYNTAGRQDLSPVVAPPYDVLSRQQRDALAARDPHNIVQIDLPHMPPDSLGPPEAYARSAELLKLWLDEGVLRQDAQPALYYYEQTFEIGGIAHNRSAFFARVRLEELGAGAVMPHEQTFSGPKEDRLALTKATRCNLSQVFGLYPDESNQVLDTLKPQSAPPDCFAELGGVRSELWVVREQAKINAMIELMTDRKIYIADGHHRYGTSLNYRRHLVESGQSLDEEHPVNFISMLLVSTADPGLVILPVHRVLRDLPKDFAAKLRAATAEQFDWIDTHLTAQHVAEFDSVIAARHRRALGLYDRAADRLHILVPRSEDLLADCAPDASPAVRTLCVAVLHRYLLEEVLAKKIAPGCRPRTSYVKDAAEAVGLCSQDEYQAVFLLQPTTMAQMLSVIEAGQLMPHKSTFFYPKVATGLIINPLYH